MDERWPFEGRNLDWFEWREAMGLPSDMKTYERWLANWRDW